MEIYQQLPLIGTSKEQRDPTTISLLLAHKQLFACVNELDAIALVLKAIGETEPVPSAILALILARRQWCEGEVAHTANTRETYECLSARRREGVDVALVTT
jgi:hypothetical protein